MKRHKKCYYRQYGLFLEFVGRVGRVGRYFVSLKKIRTKMKLTIDIEPVSSLREMQEFKYGGWQRKKGTLYFHQLEDGGLVPRVVTDSTNGAWLKKMIDQKRIYICKETIICETS